MNNNVKILWIQSTTLKRNFLHGNTTGLPCFPTKHLGIYQRVLPWKWSCWITLIQIRIKVLLGTGNQRCLWPMPGHYMYYTLFLLYIIIIGKFIFREGECTSPPLELSKVYLWTQQGRLSPPGTPVPKELQILFCITYQNALGSWEIVSVLTKGGNKRLELQHYDAAFATDCLRQWLYVTAVHRLLHLHAFLPHQLVLCFHLFTLSFSVMWPNQSWILKPWKWNQ